MRKLRARRAAGITVIVAAMITALLPMAAMGDAADNPSYWENKYPNAVECYKHTGSSSHGTVSKNGKTVTLKKFQPSWPGDRWEVLVVKDKKGSKVYELPTAGKAYTGKDGKKVSHWIVCKGEKPKPDPKVHLEITKKWLGDDHGNATVTFAINGSGAYAPGEKVDVTHLAGQRVTITENVTGLADECEFDAKLPKKFWIPKDFKDGKVIKKTAKNNVKCEEPPVDDPTLGLSLTKAWAGDDVDTDNVVVTFTLGQISFGPGDVVDVTDYAGTSVAITETVTGLADECDYTSSLTEEIDLPQADDQTLKIGVTNTVDCDEPDDSENPEETTTTTTVPDSTTEDPEDSTDTDEPTSEPDTTDPDDSDQPEVEAETDTDPEDPDDSTDTDDPQDSDVTDPEGTDEDPETDGTTESTLPFTGVGTEGMASMALAALLAGTGLVLLTKRGDEFENEG